MTRKFTLIVAAAAVAGLSGCAVYPDNVYSDPGYGTTMPYVSGGTYNGYNGYGGYSGYDGYGTSGAVITQPYVVQQPAPVYIYGGQTYQGGYGRPAYVAPPFYGRPYYNGRRDDDWQRRPGYRGHRGQPDQAQPQPQSPQQPGTFPWKVPPGAQTRPPVAAQPRPQYQAPPGQFPWKVPPAAQGQAPAEVQQGRPSGGGRGRGQRGEADTHSNSDRR